MNIRDILAKIIIVPLAKLSSTPEVLRMRAELKRLQRRLDELEKSVDERFLALKHEMYAEIKKLELRVQEMELQMKALRLRVEATERELSKLPGTKSPIASPDGNMGLAIRWEKLALFVHPVRSSRLPLSPHETLYLTG
jgi:hypothetical protein